MEQREIERIARATLKELGLPRPELEIVQLTGKPGHWEIAIVGNRSGPSMLRIRCGEGSTAQWVREQILNQYLS